MVSMPPPSPEQSGSRRRRLRAVMAADVANFTGLVSVDETNTLEAIWTTRKIAQEELAIHGGWLFGLPGDGIFALFESAIDAVQCALQTQARIKTAPGLGALRLRVGVHLGEVLFQDDLPFGEALVIASRLESLAEPGTILISSSVMEAVAPRISADFAEKGVVSLKHSPRRIATFTVAARRPDSEDEGSGPENALDHNTLLPPTREPSPAVPRGPSLSQEPPPGIEPRPHPPEPVPSKPLPSFGSNLLSALAAAARGGWEAARGPSTHRDDAGPPTPSVGRTPGAAPPSPQGPPPVATGAPARPAQIVSPVPRLQDPAVRLPQATPWPFPPSTRPEEPGPQIRDPGVASTPPPAAAILRPGERPALKPSVGMVGPRAERALDLLEASSPVFLDDLGPSDEGGTDVAAAVVEPAGPKGMDARIDLARSSVAFDDSALDSEPASAGSPEKRDAAGQDPNAAETELKAAGESDVRQPSDFGRSESGPAAVPPLDGAPLPSAEPPITGAREATVGPVGADARSPLATALDETADWEDGEDTLEDGEDAFEDESEDDVSEEDGTGDEIDPRSLNVGTVAIAAQDLDPIETRYDEGQPQAETPDAAGDRDPTADLDATDLGEDAAFGLEAGEEAEFGDRTENGEETEFGDETDYGDETDLEAAPIEETGRADPTGDDDRIGSEDKSDAGNEAAFGDETALEDETDSGDETEFGDETESGDETAFGDETEDGEETAFGEETEQCDLEETETTGLPVPGPSSLTVLPRNPDPQPVSPGPANVAEALRNLSRVQPTVQQSPTASLPTATPLVVPDHPIEDWGGDTTLNSSRPPIDLAQAAMVYSEECIRELSQDLLVYIGPVARMLVQRYAQQYADPMALVDTLAEEIPSPAERAAFLVKARKTVRRLPPTTLR